ncbi:MAG: four helix bundle protein [Planctomycetes bacterium]|nr:four helix bundle protein [Planctomycetota bacterium]
MGESIKHFTDLDVWRKSHSLFLNFIKDMETISASTASREITKQMVRSIDSIGANTAEGFNSRTTKEYIRYLDIAKRTTAESENWFYKLRDTNFLNRETATTRIKDCIEISKMLQGLMKSLAQKPKQ